MPHKDRVRLMSPYKKGPEAWQLREPQQHLRSCVRLPVRANIPGFQQIYTFIGRRRSCQQRGECDDFVNLDDLLAQSSQVLIGQVLRTYIHRAECSCIVSVYVVLYKICQQNLRNTVCPFFERGSVKGSHGQYHIHKDIRIEMHGRSIALYMRQCFGPCLDMFKIRLLMVGHEKWLKICNVHGSHDGLSPIYHDIERVV